MTESIEQLEERKRRMELEASIANMQRKEKAYELASRVPGLLAKAGVAFVYFLAFCGTLSAFFWFQSLSRSYPKGELLAQAIFFWAPLLGLYFWRRHKATRR